MPGRKINLDRFDEIDLATLSTMPFKKLIPLYEDLATTDITDDKEIQFNQEGLQLHKSTQYALQYMMFSINKLKNEKKKLEEMTLISQKEGKKEEELLQAQSKKLLEQQRALKMIDQDISDLKESNQFEQKRVDENEDMIKQLKSQLKQGKTTLDPSSSEVKELKRLMSLASSPTK